MTTTSSSHGLRFGEFVGLVAALMAINALGIDMMLPALPALGRALNIVIPNERQYIVSAYVLGFGSAQIFYGPLADRYGRKPLLVTCLSLFVLASVAVTFAVDLRSIVIARFVQGVAAAATRVLSTSIVRDCYEGRRMARVMSLSFIVFLACPILAPSIGQLIMLVGPWQWIFYFLALFGATLLLWAVVRLPETLNPEHRRPIRVDTIVDAVATVLGNRTSLGYTLATTCLYGTMLGYINTVQQVFADVFRQPGIFTLVFAGSAAAMGFASLLNARIVERLGTRRVSHGGLLALVAVSLLHLAVAIGGHETVLIFALFQAATLAGLALSGSNFSAMAMEPLGHMAGTGSAIQGPISSVGGALLGLAISQRFDGTLAPLIEGYVALGGVALLIVLVTERGRLFRPHHPRALA